MLHLYMSCQVFMALVFQMIRHLLISPPCSELCLFQDFRTINCHHLLGD
jgi:hypothetical protein